MIRTSKWHQYNILSSKKASWNDRFQEFEQERAQRPEWVQQWRQDNPIGSVHGNDGSMNPQVLGDARRGVKQDRPCFTRNIDSATLRDTHGSGF